MRSAAVLFAALLLALAAAARAETAPLVVRGV
jgi:hypothetical protein